MVFRDSIAFWKVPRFRPFVLVRATCRILPVVLYGCENWSLTWREERRLGVFKNKVLRRIIGSKKTR